MNSPSNFTEGKKWLICLVVGILFFIIAAPFMYQLTGKVTDLMKFETSVNGCPNYYGLIIHTIVFIVLLRLLMFIKL